MWKAPFVSAIVPADRDVVDAGDKTVGQLIIQVILIFANDRRTVPDIGLMAITP